MFKVNDYVIYKNDLCIVKGIANKKTLNQKYYVLNPIMDKSLIINVPIENKFGSIRKVITKKAVEEIIKDIPNINIINISNDKMIEQEYKKKLAEGSHHGLISIIKTTYLRNKDRIDNNRRVGERDNLYFEKTEQILYNEFSYVLGLSYEDTKKYIIDTVNESATNE